MLSEGKIMEVLEAYDLTGSFRSSAQLCGVDHHTVRRYVAARDAGLDPAAAVVRRERVTDPFADKISEWIDRSRGRMAGRFAAGDLESILASRREQPRRAGPGHSLQRGTSAWSQLGAQGDDRP